MNKKYTKFLIIIFFVALILSGLFYFRYQVYYAHGKFVGTKTLEIAKGDGNKEVAKKMKEANLISREIYFYYYIKSKKLSDKIMPCVYEFSGNMTIPEIVQTITNSEEKFIKITFPEGFTARQMAEKLTASGLPGQEFLAIVSSPGELKKRYSYLTPEKIKTLEGFLFPDTYFFKKDTLAKDIVGRLLDTFDQKLTDQMEKDILSQNKSMGEIVTMASMVEKEVQTAEDMKTASGIFWKRIANGQRLESDAPLSYILQDTNDQHRGKDLALDSPYNTYRNIGLPPTPISNPGLSAINASIYPIASKYNFFLTVTIDGKKKVIYSATFDEHKANRKKYGL
ncbi:MAG: endolytic transglycosylase MltG [Candidatus Moraniibacteriota bacterium]